ncbi:hypothetical protein [Verrucomicrobium spinosum]|uniref:hypothetical protein n=1 Tax=Verrucomicrobium spinosum TaxID=2736 RepID=UPI0031B5B297
MRISRLQNPRLETERSPVDIVSPSAMAFNSASPAPGCTCRSTATVDTPMAMPPRNLATMKE